MGQYWIATCDTCKQRFKPEPMKWREIAMSRENLMKLGLFFMLHNRHEVQIVGDEWNDEEWEHACREYQDQPERDFEEMREGCPYTIVPLVGQLGRCLAVSPIGGTDDSN